MRTWLFPAAMTLAGMLAACGGGGGGGGGQVTFRDATEADLANKAFAFGPGFFEDDPQDPQSSHPSTLTIGPFHEGVAPFSLVNDVDGSIFGGTLAVGASCTATVTFLQLAGEDLFVLGPGDLDAVSLLDPCEIGSNGSLRLTDEFADSFTSAPGIAPQLLEELAIPLSPLFEVEPAVPLEDRLETGTATLRFFSGNLLTYSLAVENLTAGDALTNSHIHSGGVTVNGPVFVTFVGGPPQPARPLVPAFAGASSIAAGLILTPEEALALAGSTEYYVNIHSQQVGAGLVRGQLRQPIAAAFNVPLTVAAVVPVPPPGRTETGFATLRVVDGNVLASRLRVTDLVVGDAVTAAHIHVGGPDVNGDVFVGLPGTPTVDAGTGDIVMVGEVPLTAEVVSALDDPARAFYVNVHTTQVPDGLIRGQLFIPARFAARIQPILDVSCTFAGCHDGTPATPMSLRDGEAYANLVGAPATPPISTNALRVAPGNRAGSELFRRITAPELAIRMPLALTALPQEDIDRIGAWIDQGARDN